jgi:hypothetical protein
VIISAVAKRRWSEVVHLIDRVVTDRKALGVFDADHDNAFADVVHGVTIAAVLWDVGVCSASPIDNFLTDGIGLKLKASIVENALVNCLRDHNLHVRDDIANVFSITINGDSAIVERADELQNSSSCVVLNNSIDDSRRDLVGGTCDICDDIIADYSIARRHVVIHVEEDTLTSNSWAFAVNHYGVTTVNKQEQ